MVIDIRQHKFTIGDAYDIYTDEKRTNSAYTQILTIGTVINLAQYGTDKVLLSIERMICLFGPTYVITKNNKTYTFDTKSWFNGHYKCIVGNVEYDIYGHHNNVFSVYCQNRQVAYWTSADMKILEGDKYKIVADDDCNSSLITAFCLIIDNYYFNNSGLFSFNFRLFGYGKFGFDETWQPKLKA